MRTIHADVIRRAVHDLSIKVNIHASDGMKMAIANAKACENSQMGVDVLTKLEENMLIASQENIPMCQDTGMAVIFIDIGQDVHVVGGNIEDAINQGVREGYEEGYLRKSVVRSPFNRVNTLDNTPAIIHYNIISGEVLRITFMAKGFGSENKSRIYMLAPAEGREGVKKSIVDTIIAAGPYACPPLVVGVGIGGTFEKAAIMAKHALIREVNGESGNQEVAALEAEIIEEVNASGIGPAGLGGTTTVLSVCIETFSTHIAGLPVAINICCHANRHEAVEL